MSQAIRSDPTARVVSANFADDFINPPELLQAEDVLGKLKNGRSVIVPVGPPHAGHLNYFFADLWAPYVAEALGAAQ